MEETDASFKYEDVYIKGYGYGSVPDLERGLRAYFRFYNEARLHLSPGYKTPAEVYRAGPSEGPAKE